MQSLTQTRTALLLTLTAAIATAWFVAALGYWEDDAYIHLEFARSLASGHGFSFNGHLVYGDTSPLWVWLLVAFHAVIPDWMAAGKTLTAVAAIFALTGIFAFARSLVREHLAPDQANLFAALMVLVAVTNPYFGYWAFSGMEALAAAGLACWAATCVSTRPITTMRLLAGALAAGLAPLLRPEMLFFTALLGLILLYRATTPGAPPATALGLGWVRRLYRLSLLLTPYSLLLALPSVTWALYALHTFGTILPNTNAAKRAAPHDAVLPRLLNIYLSGFPVILLCGFLLLLWWFTTRRRNAKQTRLLATRYSLLPILWAAINALFYIADHTFVQTRYIFVTAPALTVALLAVARLNWSAGKWHRAYTALIAFALVFGASISLLATRPLIHNKVLVDRVYVELADYLRTLPPDAPVAHYSIGEAAFLSQHPLIDTGGITRPGILPYLNDPNDTRRQAWVLAQGAQYEVADHAPVPGSTLLWSRNLPTTGWYLNPRRYNGHELIQVWKLPTSDSNITPQSIH